MAYDFCLIKSVEGRLCAIGSGLDRLNHGSVIEAIFFREDDVISQPPYSFGFDNFYSAALNGSLVLRSGAEGFRFRFTPDTGSFTENSQETDDGVFYSQLFTLSIPKDRPEITWLKYQMRYPRYAIIYRDGNGTAKLLRNQRVKLDLDLGRNRADYNGHVLSAVRSTDSPSLFWKIEAGAPLEGIFTAASLAFSTQFYNIPEGWLAGRVLELTDTPVSASAMVVIYNQAKRLSPGEHYTLNGKQLVLLFTDEIDGSGAGTIHVLYATNKLGTDIGGFNQHTATKTVAYSSGETFALPAAPIDQQNLLVIYNNVLALRPSVDMSLTGSTVTLLFDGDPAGDEDTFACFYATEEAGPLAIVGWSAYTYTVAADVAANFTFDLPNTPLANSLLVWLDNDILLEEGVDYNLNSDEIEILFAGYAGQRIHTWYAY